MTTQKEIKKDKKRRKNKNKIKEGNETYLLWDRTNNFRTKIFFRLKRYYIRIYSL